MTFAFSSVFILLKWYTVFSWVEAGVVGVRLAAFAAGG